MKEQKAFLVRAIFLTLALVLVIRLVNLQIVRHSEFHRMAQDNAAKISPIFPPRGWITDRYGNVLVTNESRFSLLLLPYLIPEKDRYALAERLQRLTIIPPREFFQKIENSAGEFQSVTVRKNISRETATRLAEAREFLPGVVVPLRPMRKYREGILAAHLLGYVGEVSSRELARLPEAGYVPKDFIGKDGIERQYDLFLRGRRGGQSIQVDVRGRPVRLAEMVEPVAGLPVRLTLDSQLQMVAEGALGAWKGGVVVMNPRTGEILAMASRPTFDPADVDLSLSSSHHPFLNRTISEYPPGSIFKIVTLAAALASGKVNLQETFHCPGWYQIGSRIAACWRTTGHGNLSAIEGLVWSCDVVFYELGRRLEIGPLWKYAHYLGLGQSTGIDLPGERPGLVPTESWKLENKGEPWYPGDFINHGIGQGFIKVTPLQMALAYGALATGKKVQPHIVQDIRGRDGKVVYRHAPTLPEDIPIDPKVLDIIRRALRQTILRGTGVVARVSGYPAAGKTGTAENPGLAHAWFICFAPWNDPEIVISVLIEHGEHGDRAAAGVAKKILEWFKSHRADTLVYESEEFPVQRVVEGKYRPENYASSVIRTEIPSREPIAE